MSNDLLCSSIFAVLKECAQNHSTITITYSALGLLVGVHHRDPSLHTALGSIWQWCGDNKHPHINAIVVRKSGSRQGLPGTGYKPTGTPITRQNWERMREAVFRQDWRAIPPPHSWPSGYCGG